MDENQATERARQVWPEAEGFERVPGGWTFRVGAGYASVTDTGRVAIDPQGLRGHAAKYMPTEPRRERQRTIAKITGPLTPDPDADLAHPPAEDQRPAPEVTADTDLIGLVWNSFVYQPGNTLDGLTGPDANTRCETPRHTFGNFKPPAEWLELFWYPGGDKTVARAWKTCEACHVGMAQAAEKTRS